MFQYEVLFLIGGSILAGTIVPGPSFILVSKIALESRLRGVFAALGVATASVSFAVFALTGLLLLLESVPSLYMFLRVSGGAYLIFLGYRMWRTAGGISDRNSRVQRTSLCGAFALGGLTQMSNPKAALVYASTFAAFLPTEPDQFLPLALMAMIFLLSASWYILVAVAVSLPRVNSRYLESKRSVDRVAAVALASIGFGIVLDAGFKSFVGSSRV